jgi:hypothetical protein
MAVMLVVVCVCSSICNALLSRRLLDHPADVLRLPALQRAPDEPGRHHLPAIADLKLQLPDNRA